MTLTNDELTEAIDKTFNMYQKSCGSQKEAIHDHLLKLLREQAKRAETKE